MKMKFPGKLNVRICWVFVFFLSVLLNTYFFFILHRYSKHMSSLQFHELYYLWTKNDILQDKPLIEGLVADTDSNIYGLSKLQNVKGKNFDTSYNTQKEISFKDVQNDTSVKRDDSTTEYNRILTQSASSPNKLINHIPTKVVTLFPTFKKSRTKSIIRKPSNGEATNVVKSNTYGVNVVEKEKPRNITTTKGSEVGSQSIPQDVSASVSRDKGNTSRYMKLSPPTNKTELFVTKTTIRRFTNDSKSSGNYSDSGDAQNNGKLESPLLPGLLVDWFKDVGVNKTMYNLKWHPLFPHIPIKTTVIDSLSETKYIRPGFARRIYGFLIPDVTSQYEFEIGSRDGIEIVLLDSLMTRENQSFVETFGNMTVVMNMTFSVKEMMEQDKKIGFFDIFNKSDSAYLQKDRLYFLDILQGGGAYGRMNIKWRKVNESKFERINESYIFHHEQTKDLIHKNTVYEKPRPRFPPTSYEINDLKINVIKNFNDVRLQPSCKTFTKHKKKMEENLAWAIADQWLTYPEEGFGYYFPQNKSQIILNETEAFEIVNKMFDALKRNLNNTHLKFKKIGQVSKNFDYNYEKINGENQFYFVEFDVEIDEEITRVSKYVQISDSGNVCFRNDFHIDTKTKIYLMTPVRNQIHWVHHLLHSIENIVNATHEDNIELIIVDYNSTDGNITRLLENHRVPYQYIYKNATMFNKVEGLNIALNYTDNNSIAFVLDLHLEIPSNLFSKIRKHTIEGISAYCPTLLKLHLGYHEMYMGLISTDFSHWMDMGYGMMAMYKSDWMAIGGMNERKFGTAWGGEDWELVDRIASYGYYLFHMRLPRFYHIYHSNHDIWDGTKL